jgi:hypothetical protein
VDALRIAEADQTTECDDSTLGEAKWKAAKSISRKTRKPVIHSQEKVDF